MATWSARTSGYKLGVLVLFLGSGFYLIGYASPFWYQYTGNTFSGLWLGCSSSIYGGTRCSSFSATVSWFKAVQAMESLGLIGLFISCVYAIVVNCCQITATHSRILEIVSGISGLCGFIGCMIFVGKSSEWSSDYYGWAFGLNLTGCILVMIAAVIIFATNRPDLATPATGGTVIFSGAAPVQGGHTVIMQQGQVLPPPGQSYPPQPGVGYGAQPGYGYAQGYSGAGQYPSAYPSGPPQVGYAPPTGYSGQSYPYGYSGEVGSQEPK